MDKLAQARLVIQSAIIDQERATAYAHDEWMADVAGARDNYHESRGKVEGLKQALAMIEQIKSQES